MCELSIVGTDSGELALIQKVCQHNLQGFAASIPKNPNHWRLLWAEQHVALEARQSFIPFGVVHHDGHIQVAHREHKTLTVSGTVGRSSYLARSVVRTLSSCGKMPWDSTGRSANHAMRSHSKVHDT